MKKRGRPKGSKNKPGKFPKSDGECWNEYQFAKHRYHACIRISPDDDPARAKFIDALLRRSGKQWRNRSNAT